MALNRNRPKGRGTCHAGRRVNQDPAEKSGISETLKNEINFLESH